MGIIGYRVKMGFQTWMDPEAYPDPNKMSTFDPLFGFPNGRKEREIKFKYSDLKKLNIPIRNRDYCSHKYIDWNDCYLNNFPLVHKCKHELHDYHMCVYDDVVLRMKEFEREKRLLARERRIKAKNEINARKQLLEQNSSAEMIEQTE